MALYRNEAALQQNYKLEIKRSNVDPDSLFLIPYKSHLERLPCNLAFKYTSRVVLLWDMLCISLVSKQSFHKAIPKLMRALQVSLSGWKKPPKHLRKSLIISTANNFCSTLAYFLIHGKIQGHKFSSCDF